MTAPQKTLAATDREALMATLKARFEENMPRHQGLPWEEVEGRLVAQPEKLWSLHQMEATGGEPDVVDLDPQTDELIFMDCAAQSPAGRRSLCFDQAAWASRKEQRPQTSAWAMAEAMGIRILTEAQYLFLQSSGAVDTKSSSWIATPGPMRRQGGALFGDCRYGRVFFYHNGAQSYYAGRGFRGVLRV